MNLLLHKLSSARRARCARAHWTRRRTRANRIQIRFPAKPFRVWANGIRVQSARDQLVWQGTMYVPLPAYIYVGPRRARLLSHALYMGIFRVHFVHSSEDVRIRLCTHTRVLLARSPVSAGLLELLGEMNGLSFPRSWM